MRHLTILALLALLGACGQTGPLYLPEQSPPQTVDEHSPETAADAAP